MDVVEEDNGQHENRKLTRREIQVYMPVSTSMKAIMLIAFSAARS